MARISKADRLKQYRGRIDRARKARRPHEQTWRRLIDLYLGKHFDSVSDEDQIAVNLAFSTVNVIFPSVSVNNPKFTVMPNAQEDVDRAVIVEAGINYWWRHYDFHQEFRMAVKDSTIIGHGWLKIGWRYREAEQAYTEEERLQQFDAMRSEAEAFAAENPDMAGDVPTDDEIAASLPEVQMVPVEDRPFVERVSPFDMFVDPEATSIRDAKWICQRVVRTLEEVRNDPRYKKAARSRVESDSYVGGDGGAGSEPRSRFGRRGDPVDDDAKRVTIWEYYDLEAQTVAVCADKSDEFLIDPQPIPFAFGHPFVFVPNYTVPDEFYPVGDLEQIESLQLELNKTRSQMMNHRKKFARKYMFRERAFGPQGREALESDRDNEMVPVIDENSPFSELIAPVPITMLSPEIYNHSQIIEEDIDTVSGVSEYARGSSPDIRRTATEAAIIQDSINARSADKLSVIEGVLALCARRLVQVMQQFVTGQQIMRVVGPQSEIVWIPYEREDIRGEFDFSVEAGSTQPQNETFRRQQALALMQALGPLIGTVIDPVAIAKHVLQFGFNVKNPDKFIMAGMAAPPGAPGADPAAAGMLPPGVGAPGMAGGGSPIPNQLQNEEPAPESPVAGIPAEVANQLAMQFGLGFG